ncbi:MAG: HD domain-containing protein [Candidatus Acidiferrum sp.]
MERYIYDALYGPVYFPDYVWKIMFCPELQRLREVRLCNINSLCLTGGANTNRYEHSLGAAYLATKCIESSRLRIDERTARRIVLAALLHDVGSAAFGHSVQYVLDSQGYRHESLFEMVSSGAQRAVKSPKQTALFDSSNGVNDSTGQKYDYRHALVEPIYFGLPPRLSSLIPDDELKTISQMVQGEGPYHALINGTVDLDNIDNVFRLAYHMGLVRSGQAPLKLASSITIEKENIVIDDGAIDSLREWYEIRKTLYRYLLLNPDEFSAKCMLQEALEIAQGQSTFSFYWQDVDYQLLERLSQCSDETSAIISRLMIGDLYGCIGIYSCPDINFNAQLANPLSRRQMELNLGTRIRAVGAGALKSAVVGLHPILDVNKTRRPVNAISTSGKSVEIGEPIRRVLVGVFFKNIHLGMATIDRGNLGKLGVLQIVSNWLEEITKCSEIEELEPYAEAKEARTRIASSHSGR